MYSLALFCGIWSGLLLSLGILHNLDSLLKPENKKAFFIVSLVDVALGIIAVLAFKVSQIYPKTALADNSIVWMAPWIMLMIALPILIYTLPQPKKP